MTKLSHRKAQGQSIFAAEIELETDVETRLHTFMKDTNHKFATAKTLNPKHVAQIRGDLEHVLWTAFLGRGAPFRLGPANF
jgi:hypothetical protein